MTTPESTRPEARVGQVVDERYRIVEHIASGGMAAVYRAEHVNTRAPVAVKVLHAGLTESAEVAARFQREMQAYRQVNHANVLGALDFGRLPDNCPYMVLEYAPGQDLCVVLYHEKRFTQVRAVKIAFQTCLGLAAAHAAGVIHRDLKPENIMLVNRDGDPDFVKVVDFGIAKLTTGGKQPLTVLGSVFGTPEYLSPEQAKGQLVDHRADLYTIGIVIYEMLTGTTPFANDSVGQVLLAQTMSPPPPLPANVDGELQGLVNELLAKDPAARPQTALEVAARLGRILARLAPGHPSLAQLPAYVPAPAPAPQPAPAPAPQPALAPAPAPAPAPVIAQPAVFAQHTAPAPPPMVRAAAPPAFMPAAPAAPAYVPPAALAAVADPVEIPTTGNGCLIVAAVVGVLTVLALVLGGVLWLVL